MCTTCIQCSYGGGGGLSVQAHISVSVSRNFLILGTKMGYGLGMMPVFFSFIQAIIPDAQTKTSVFEIGSNGKRYTAGCSNSSKLIWALFTHVAHYIRLLLAAHKGQKG